MRVILCQDVESLGRLGDTVEVAPGYARNYLLPRKLVLPLTPAAERHIAKLKKLQVEREAQRRRDLAELAASLQDTEIAIAARAEGMKLYGSVTATTIARELQQKTGREFDPRTIRLPGPLRNLGEYQVTLHFAPDLESTIKLKVTNEDGEIPQKEKDEKTGQEQPG